MRSSRQCMRTRAERRSTVRQCQAIDARRPNDTQDHVVVAYSPCFGSMPDLTTQPLRLISSTARCGLDRAASATRACAPWLAAGRPQTSRRIAQAESSLPAEAVGANAQCASHRRHRWCWVTWLLERLCVRTSAPSAHTTAHSGINLNKLGVKTCVTSGFCLLLAQRRRKDLEEARDKEWQGRPSGAPPARVPLVWNSYLCALLRAHFALRPRS